MVNMSLQETIDKIKKEHEWIEGMLIEAIKYLLSNNEAIFLEKREEYNSEINKFLDNFENLIKQHYKFEEEIFFPLLPKRYEDDVKELIEEHNNILSKVHSIKETGIDKIVDKINSLKELYEISRDHVRKENIIINKLDKEKH
jgi:hemerythrin-like domain-containing protein